MCTTNGPLVWFIFKPDYVTLFTRQWSELFFFKRVCCDFVLFFSLNVCLFFLRRKCYVFHIRLKKKKVNNLPSESVCYHHVAFLLLSHVFVVVVVVSCFFLLLIGRGRG